MAQFSISNDKIIRALISRFSIKNRGISIAHKQANISMKCHMVMCFKSMKRKWKNMKVRKIKVIDPSMSCNPKRYMIDST